MPSPQSARVMRWVYAREQKSLVCELSLDANHLRYQFRTWASPRSSVSVEQYGDVLQAFQRQSELEGNLIREGWTLASYDSRGAESQLLSR